ncbi:hypothetical protein [Kosakonia sacchari]|uniref:hypothetical protein n=1 Tax=Kosakonia sacchari TaxID=1158459 RepID=UPI0015858BAD|nr:hypothetical protein [Kosakonia sacchari]NUL36634.1 hypothetical protein [Kosakonia sacchari]
MVANVIYRGPVTREPLTVNLPVNGAYNPGSIVYEANGKLVLSAGTEPRWMILSNRRFTGQDVSTAYTSGETGVAYRVEGEQEYNAMLVGAAYTKGMELKRSASPAGAFAAAASGEQVVAVFDEADRTLATNGLGDIVILSVPYIKA